MTTALPDVLARYFQAENSHSPAALAACFAEDGEVLDEGAAHRGRTAIAAWMKDAQDRYHHSAEPLSVAQGDGKTVVAARVSGQFPGSPVTLRHLFTLHDGQITLLEIRP